jgi:hypothetical protein
MHRHKVARKYPKDFSRKGDGAKLKNGELRRAVKKAEPPLAGAFKRRDNPPNSLVRVLTRVPLESFLQMLKLIYLLFELCWLIPLLQ